MKNDKKTIVYTCPMHPEVKQETPGICSECGMQLVRHEKRKSFDNVQDQLSAKASSRHAGHSTAMFFRKFWLSFILTIPVVLYANVIEKIFGWRSEEHTSELQSQSN